VTQWLHQFSLLIMSLKIEVVAHETTNCHCKKDKIHHSSRMVTVAFVYALHLDRNHTLSFASRQLWNTCQARTSCTRRSNPCLTVVVRHFESCMRCRTCMSLEMLCIEQPLYHESSRTCCRGCGCQIDPRSITIEMEREKKKHTSEIVCVCVFVRNGKILT
jgi:hypothetical protein